MLFHGLAQLMYHWSALGSAGGDGILANAIKQCESH